MEVNRDESERCIEIAIAALKAGNIDKADKFLRKANSLFPSQQAKGAKSYRILYTYRLYYRTNTNIPLNYFRVTRAHSHC